MHVLEYCMCVILLYVGKFVTYSCIVLLVHIYLGEVKQRMGKEKLSALSDRYHKTIIIKMHLLLCQPHLSIRLIQGFW